MRYMVRPLQDDFRLLAIGLGLIAIVNIFFGMIFLYYFDLSHGHYFGYVLLASSGLVSGLGLVLAMAWLIIKFDLIDWEKIIYSNR